MKESKKVLVFSIAVEGFERKFSKCIKSQINYCKKNNYQYVLIKDTPNKLYPHEAAWLKVPLLLAALAAGYEWVSFLDADCEIRSHTPDFTQHFENLTNIYSIFMAPGFSGRINSGVIFTKNHPETVNFLRTILDHADTEVPDPLDMAPYENGHFIFWGKKNPSLYLLEHDLWNNNSKLNADSYIQHYSRGRIRDEYLLTQLDIKTRLMNWLNHIFNIFSKISGSENRQPGQKSDRSISQSMKKSTSFYVKKYPYFFADFYNSIN